jgi:uncharacterized protein involved in exopolysaccharide biosynthesis
MTEASPIKPSSEPRIVDIGYLLKVWVRWLWLAVLVATLGGVYGLFNLQKKPDVYTARMIIQPEAANAGLSQLASQLGSLASAGGLSIGSGGPSPAFNRLQYLLGSFSLAHRLAENHGFIELLFGPPRAATTVVAEDAGGIGATFNRLLRTPKWQQPSANTLADTLRGMISFEKMRDSPLYEVKLSHKDPQVALRILSTTYREADELVREQDLSETRDRVAYLQGQLNSATSNDARTSMVTLMVTEQRRLMLLRSSQPYAAKIVEAPFVSDRPEPHNVVAAVAVPTVLGGFAVLLLVTMVVLFRSPS